MTIHSQRINQNATGQDACWFDKSIHLKRGSAAMRMNRSEWRRSRLPTNGITLNVVSAGPQDGPLVILLHGFPEFLLGWCHQIEALAEAGLHVVAPDQRGYTLSDKPAGIEAYTIRHLTDDVVGLADALGYRQF